MFPPRSDDDEGQSYSFFLAPRRFSTNKPTCKAISAQAWVCQPQTTHRQLLRMNHQKPASRRDFFCDATSQAANRVTAMAGHWIASRSTSLTLLAVVGPFQGRDVELAHLHHGGHGTLGFLVRLSEPLDHPARHHLP